MAPDQPPHGSVRCSRGLARHACWSTCSHRRSLAGPGPCHSGEVAWQASRLADIERWRRLCIDRSLCMTAPVLSTKLDREAPDAKARFAHNEALADELDRKSTRLNSSH